MSAAIGPVAIGILRDIARGYRFKRTKRGGKAILDRGLVSVVDGLLVLTPAGRVWLATYEKLAAERTARFRGEP